MDINERIEQMRARQRAKPASHQQTTPPWLRGATLRLRERPVRRVEGAPAPSVPPSSPPPPLDPQRMALWAAVHRLLQRGTGDLDGELLLSYIIWPTPAIEAALRHAAANLPPSSHEDGLAA